MTWLLTWLSAEPVEGVVFGLSAVCAGVAVYCAVQAWREWQDALTHEVDPGDWSSEGRGPQRW